MWRRSCWCINEGSSFSHLLGSSPSHPTRAKHHTGVIIHPKPLCATQLWLLAAREDSLSISLLLAFHFCSGFVKATRSLKSRRPQVSVEPFHAEINRQASDLIQTYRHVCRRLTPRNWTLLAAVWQRSFAQGPEIPVQSGNSFGSGIKPVM